MFLGIKATHSVAFINECKFYSIFNFINFIFYSIFEFNIFYRMIIIFIYYNVYLLLKL